MRREKKMENSERGERKNGVRGERVRENVVKENKEMEREIGAKGNE